MKRSEVNKAIYNAQTHFNQYHWVLPPSPRWDVTDFGLGNFSCCGLVLVNLAEEPEYCEKVMYAFEGQRTPAHYHKHKKEDIIVRQGKLAVQLWKKENGSPLFKVAINGSMEEVKHGEVIHLEAGARITLIPGIIHEFWPISEACIIGEVSTANDDNSDNYFINKAIGRFSHIEEDEPALVRLVSD